MTPVHPRITIEADKRDGKPCIRGMRITVNDVLGWLAHGMTEEEILAEHPGLEKEDFAAVYAFAADVTDSAYGARRSEAARSLGIPSHVVDEAVKHAWPEHFFTELIGSLPDLERPTQPPVEDP